MTAGVPGWVPAAGTKISVTGWISCGAGVAIGAGGAATSTVGLGVRKADGGVLPETGEGVLLSEGEEVLLLTYGASVLL